MRSQINITLSEEDAAAIRAEAEQQCVTLPCLIVRAVLGREPGRPPSRQELAQRVSRLERLMEDRG